MEGILWQDWVTIRGQSAIETVTQTEDTYLDVGGYEDLSIYLDVKEFSAGATLTLQTSPSKDDPSFVALLPTITLALTSSGPAVYRVYGNCASVPVARWLRWQLTGSIGWDATLRVWIAAYSYGG